MTYLLQKKGAIAQRQDLLEIAPNMACPVQFYIDKS
jgi:hypothetical protein